MTIPDASVIPFPTKPAETSPGSFEKIWGKKVKSHGYAAIPTILIRSQHRLGINSTQFCLLMHLLDLYWSPDRPPFPTKQQLADRIGIKMSSIKPNMKALEQAGLIRRVQHKTSAGDWGANTYLLDGLIQRIKDMEPEFAGEKAKRLAERKRVETPKGKRPKE
ncbi:helix-turn-helix domain-containing protein [Mesorhizobium sp.]|uniref:helix-turn-helix domain-containing protein n=1 Tax=Mesorhizobium sp. TaxID=1871066 RepID=UPI000FE82083|nr:helix-turn-helix domain-containing protein [Mesorhizobium sp.]RWA78223.1 MAG: helix-turn-helix domain-containing protein [Mesorhizobium sp.]